MVVAQLKIEKVVSQLSRVDTKTYKEACRSYDRPLSFKVETKT